MAIEDADDRAVFFDADDFALAAVYAPPSGPAVAVTVLDWKPDMAAALGSPGFLLSPAAQDAARVVWLRRDQVATPARGGTITIDGAAYPVREAVTSQDGQIWQLTLGKPA